MIFQKIDLRSLKSLLLDFYHSRKRISIIKRLYSYKTLNKIRISVKSASFEEYIKLQTPNQHGVWGNTAFISSLDFDINLVINKPNPYLILSKDISKNWLLHIEPPGYIKKLDMANQSIINKFGRIYTSDPDLYLKGGKFIASPPYVHWHLSKSSYSHGVNPQVYDYDFLLNALPPKKKEVNLVSINSGINDLPGHKLRSDFVAKICEENINFELYGASIWSKYKQYKGSLPSKWPAYYNSKFVLAVENEVSPYYWTEKFTDAILCYSIPIYYGSNRINDFFPEGSYIEIDIKDEEAPKILKDILYGDFYEKNLQNLIAARNLILEKLNMFSFFNNEINNFKNNES
jgi:hypothetical protein